MAFPMSTYFASAPHSVDSDVKLTTFFDFHIHTHTHFPKAFLRVWGQHSRWIHNSHYIPQTSSNGKAGIIALRYPLGNHLMEFFIPYSSSWVHLVRNNAIPSLSSAQKFHSSSLKLCVILLPQVYSSIFFFTKRPKGKGILSWTAILSLTGRLVPAARTIHLFTSSLPQCVRLTTT